MSEISPSTSIMMQRDNQLRAELRLRFEARTHMLQLVFTVVAALLGAVLTFKIYQLAYAGCVFLVMVGYVLFTDNEIIRLIVAYLLPLEASIDREVQTPIPGWERHMRSERLTKPARQRTRTLSFILLFIVLYSVFNALGSISVPSPLRYAVLGVVELPAALSVIVAFRCEKGFYRVDSRSDEDDPNKTGAP
jgi:hypothetical protein